jgi:hypothetical protein
MHSITTFIGGYQHAKFERFHSLMVMLPHFAICKFDENNQEAKCNLFVYLMDD